MISTSGSPTKSWKVENHDLNYSKDSFAAIEEEQSLDDSVDGLAAMILVVKARGLAAPDPEYIPPFNVFVKYLQKAVKLSVSDLKDAKKVKIGLARSASPAKATKV